MNVSVEMPVEATLKGSEAKVLLHLLKHPDAIAHTSEIMRSSGVYDYRTFNAARDRLRKLGLWENPMEFLQGARNPLESLQVGAGITEEQMIHSNNSTVANATPRITATLAAEVIHDERSLRERARDVDVAADEAGRVDVLLAAWHELFPHDSYANRVNVKKLLELGGNSAEDMLDQFEQVKARKIARPFGYIQTTLQRLAAVKPTPEVRAVEIGRPTREEPQDYMMSEPSPRTKMIHDRLVAAGLLRRDDDED